MEKKPTKTTTEKKEKTKVAVAPIKESKPKVESSRLTAVIRISGMVNIKTPIANTLDRLRLRKKYVCVLVNTKNESIKGMVENVKYFVAFGNISEDTLAKLIQARGKKIDRKNFKSEEIASSLMNGKTLEELGFKPFFRLHPPRGGIDSKIQYPKGVLGNNKDDINKLIERML